MSYDTLTQNVACCHVDVFFSTSEDSWGYCAEKAVHWKGSWRFRRRNSSLPKVSLRSVTGRSVLNISCTFCSFFFVGLIWSIKKRPRFWTTVCVPVLWWVWTSVRRSFDGRTNRPTVTLLRHTKNSTSGTEAFKMEWILLIVGSNTHF